MLSAYFSFSRKEIPVRKDSFNTSDESGNKREIFQLLQVRNMLYELELIQILAESLLNTDSRSCETILSAQTRNVFYHVKNKKIFHTKIKS